MSFSYKKQTHKSKGKAGRIPHPVGASPHSGARKNKLQKALEAREDAVRGRKAPLPPVKPKSKPKKEESPSIEKTMQSIDRMQKFHDGDKVVSEGYKDTVNKKYGGKIMYKMGGGQVVDSSYD